MRKIVLKYLIMNLVPPKQEECLIGSCILILTVTAFQRKIRHRPTKVSVQAAKNYKLIVYFLASYPSLTTWPIAINMRIIISISVYCCFLVLAGFFLFGFKNLLSHSFWILDSRILDSLAGCCTMFLFAVFCKIGALERNTYWFNV